MNVHFSPEDVSRWVAGERPPAFAHHLSWCDECQTRVNELSSMLGQFGDAVRGLSAQDDRLARFEFGQPPMRVNWQVAFVSAVATVALAFMLLSPKPASYVKVAEPQKSDAELLSRVQEQISRSVPEHMEPLTELFAWSLPSQNPGSSRNEE